VIDLDPLRSEPLRHTSPAEPKHGSGDRVRKRVDKSSSPLGSIDHGRPEIERQLPDLIREVFAPDRRSLRDGSGVSLRTIEIEDQPFIDDLASLAHQRLEAGEIDARDLREDQPVRSADDIGDTMRVRSPARRESLL
jgi:hypothetical protein